MKIGKLLPWLLPVITFIFFVLAKLDTAYPLSVSWLTASQLLSLLGVTVLSLTFLLSARFKFIEDWFGGLDKAYKYHHVLGGVSFVMLLHHPLFLAINALPSINASFNYLWFSNNLSRNFGVAGIYSLMLMLILTFLINLPYSTWKKTHELMGVALLFSSLHIITVTSDVSRYIPLRIWIISLLIIALYCAIYRRFIYSALGPKYRYIVDEVNRNEDILDVWLKPVSKKMAFHSGQFVFARFDNYGTESHPFSLANNPTEERIRFGIKILGDYTLALKDLVVGEKVTVWGPYGKFNEGTINNKDLLLIAGGIGITPFLSIISSEIDKNINRKIDVFYCVKNEDEAVYNEEIMKKLKSNNLVKLWLHCSEDKGRINGEHIYKSLGNLDNKKIMLCGPVPMMESLANQFKSLGVKNSDIIFEDFKFK